MTKEETINHLITVRNTCIASGYDSAVKNACDMAIEALTAIDDIKQEIFNAIDNVPITLSRNDADNLLKMDIQDIIDKHLKKAKTGHWIEGKYRDTCDKCRCTYPKNIGIKKYCPNCGAKMESEENE